MVVCKNEELLGIAVSSNNFSKKIWMRAVQTGSDEDQSDKTTAGS